MLMPKELRWMRIYWYLEVKRILVRYTPITNGKKKSFRIARVLSSNNSKSSVLLNKI